MLLDSTQPWIQEPQHVEWERVKTAVFLCCSRLSETVQEPVKSSDPLETLLL